MLNRKEAMRGLLDQVSSKLHKTEEQIAHLRWTLLIIIYFNLSYLCRYFASWYQILLCNIYEKNKGIF